MTRRLVLLTFVALVVSWTAGPVARSADFHPLAPDAVAVPEGGKAPAASPRTYPDEKGFEARRKILVEGVAQQDLGAYRRGWFKGGDPGKYLPLHAMAKLLLNSQDAEARKYLNDNRAPRQHYHFAAVNWSRLLPQFGDALTDQTKKVFADLAKGRSSYVSTQGRGTENHHVMQLTSGVVLPDYLKVDRFGGMPVKQARAASKKWLKWYVHNLYHYGQGEWDSSTYVMFDINGMLNIYDFSKDPECRLLARAALDWYVTAYALKYVNGMHTGPKERGWTSHAFDSIGDQSAWLWWGSTAKVTPQETRTWRFAMQPALSSWRPNKVICHIARRELPRLPVEFHNTKPNYWHGLDKAPIKPVPNVSQESLYITKHYTLASLWWDPDTCTQVTRLQLGAATKFGAVAFTGSAPGTYNGKPRYTSGQGSYIVRPNGNVDPKTEAVYVQYAQAGPTVICMAAFGPKAKERYTYFTTPVPAKAVGRWFVMQAGDTFLGVLPLTSQVKVGKLGEGKKALDALIFPGDKSGFVLQTADTTRYKTVEEFASALAGLKVDGRAWATKMRISTETTDGRTLVMQYQPGKERAAAWVNDKSIDWSKVGVYDGPYVRQKDGVLTVTDGKDGFQVDFSGEMPIYRAFQPAGFRSSTAAK